MKRIHLCMKVKTRFTAPFSLILVLFFFAAGIVGQEEELDLMDSVSNLQNQLKAEKVEQRDAAEQELLKLGPQILEFLESPDEDSTTDFRKRLSTIRKKLEKEVVATSANPSTVSVKGTMTVGDALKKIERQTRNKVDASDASMLDEEITLDLKQVEFWPALTTIMKKTGLQIDPYGSAEPGQLMLTRNQAPNQSNQPTLPTSSNKIFQVQVVRVDSSVNLQQPQLDFTTVNLLVRWEPRLRPISVDIPMSKVSIVDEFDDDLMLANQREVVYGMVQPEIPQVDFSLQLPRVDRQVESLKSVKATIDALLPGKTEVFRFKKLSKLKPGVKQEKAGARVTFGGIAKNEDAYSVKMSISFDEENNALESHQGWVFQNEVYLLDSQGNREEAISLETLRQDNEKVTVQYYFIDKPGDRTLIYKTPASVIKLPVPIELAKIPLP